MNVSPCSFESDVEYGVWTDSVNSRDPRQACSWLCGKGVNLSGLILGEFGGDTLRSMLSRHPSLSCRVCHVLGVRSKPKVSGIAALGIVAGVANFHSTRNLAFGNGPRDAMRLPKPSAKSDSSVAFGVSRPFPTLIWSALADLGPKVCGKLLGYDAGNHVRLHRGGLARPRTALQRSRGRSYCSHNSIRRQAAGGVQ